MSKIFLGNRVLSLQDVLEIAVGVPAPVVLADEASLGKLPTSKVGGGEGVGAPAAEGGGAVPPRRSSPLLPQLARTSDWESSGTPLTGPQTRAVLASVVNQVLLGKVGVQ